MAKLIFLEHGLALREELAEFFYTNNHQVVVAPDLCAFRRLWDEEAFHIAILDMEQPKGDGIDLVRELRVKNKSTGIIIYTAKTQSCIAGLDSGADNYLVKPIQPLELLAFVNSLARRLGHERARDTWTIDCIRRELASPDGVVTSLSARDYLVLVALIKGQGCLVTRRQIVAALDENFMAFDQRRLDTHIRRLRSKAEEHLGWKLPVNTVHGQGFIFSAPAVFKN